MKRQKFELRDTERHPLKERLVKACGRYDHALFLDSNGHRDRWSQYAWMAALGDHKLLNSSQHSFASLKEFFTANRDWLFGHLSFELKNQVEHLSTRHPAAFSFPSLSFFVPDTLVYQQDQRIFCESYSLGNESELEALLSDLPLGVAETPAGVQLEARQSREDYLRHVAALKEELQYGNIYEINYCTELAAHARLADVPSIFNKLNSQTRAPFAAFYKHSDQYLLCASPERYLQKHGERVISQPIKGTAPRYEDAERDKLARQALMESEKERSENVMITDLVRNDLSRTAQKGSVRVEELFGIYSFATVHQMITTISSQLDPRHSLSDLLATTFPMGSMTGAPKVKALELIDKHETFARGLYSGSVGYISPVGDCDFNVVIRSLFYNQQTEYLSARVGSALTILCDAAAEYRECLLKAEALLRCLDPAT